MFGLQKQTIAVEGMMCEHCAAHVKEALEKIDGVKLAKIDLAKKRATVKVEREVSSEEFERAIQDAGYRFGGVVD